MRSRPLAASWCGPPPASTRPASGRAAGPTRPPCTWRTPSSRPDTDLAPDIAADAVDEWLALTAGPARAEELRGDGQRLHFHATDPGLSGTGEWLVTRTPSGVTVEHGHGKADVAVRGPAVRMLLVLTRRLPPSDPAIEIFGERALLTYWLQHTPF